MAAKARLLERVETPNLCHVANAHGPQLPHVFPGSQSEKKVADIRPCARLVGARTNIGHLFLRLRVGIVMKPAITHLERAQQEDQAQQEQ